MAKKKDEHHGGAWKVAYADFVTSMMALFIVLWVLVAEEKPEVMAQVALYFKDPGYATDTEKKKTPSQTPGLMEAQVKATQKDSSMQDYLTRENQSFLKAISRDFVRLLNVQDEEKEPLDIQPRNRSLKTTPPNSPSGAPKSSKTWLGWWNDTTSRFSSKATPLPDSIWG